jgi:hypothetical protein
MEYEFEVLGYCDVGYPVGSEETPNDVLGGVVLVAPPGYTDVGAVVLLAAIPAGLTGAPTAPGVDSGFELDWNGLLFQNAKFGALHCPLL